MTDAPGSFDAIHLVVREVSAHIESGVPDSSEGGWEVLAAQPATYDLLTLRNGVFATLGVATVPAGHYTQVRLKLDPGSNIVVDGVEHPLKVPSGLQSGLKLVGEFDVPAGGTTDIVLDFDASRSVILTGNGSYMLKPVVKVLPVSTAGAITGTVEPAGTATKIFALQPPDTLGTTEAEADGRYTLSVLAAGTYSLGFHPAAGFRDTTLSGIVVTAGTTTVVDTVALTPQ
jgi:hypothetical protein